MKSLIVVLSLILTSVNLEGADRPDLAVSNIEKPLFEDANAIVRLAEETYEILSSDKVRITETFIVTILNAKAEESLNYNIAYYGIDSKVDDMDAYLYDKWGNELDKSRNKDIEDEPVSDGFSLYNDTRVKYVSFDYNKFPYTLAFTTKKTELNSFLWPVWMPLRFDNVAVEKSSFSIIFPDGQNVQYKENLDGLGDYDRVIESNKYSWVVENKTAYLEEKMGLSIRNQLPSVSLNLGDISYNKYSGDVSTWSGFGEFYYNLNKGRDKVPKELATKLKALVADATSVEEKAQRIYNYLQDNTRYVSVQLGIGGFQCFPAEYVAKKGFGDCKALSNFMQSMLKVVDIPSNYALVYSGSKPILLDNDFAQSAFNHVILAIPQPKDTIWLECTSQEIPFGYLGTSTMNRDVLWVDRDGKSKLVRTPDYSPKEHALKTEAEIEVSEDGSGTVGVTIEATGFQHRGYRGLKDNFAGDELKQKFESRAVTVPGGFILDDYNISVEKHAPMARVSYAVNASNLAKVSNARLFLTPALLEGVQGVPKSYKNRKQPLVLQTGYFDEMYVTFKLPNGYTLEAMPENKSLDTPFGTFDTTYELKENQLHYSRVYLRNSGTFPKEEYNNYQQLQKQIAKSDKEKVVLKKISN